MGAPLAPIIDRLIAELGVTRAEFATALAASERSVIRWHAGGSYPQYEARFRLAEMTELADRLQASFGDDGVIAAWLRAPSDYFHGAAPIDAFLRGHFSRIEAALDADEARRSLEPSTR